VASAWPQIVECRRHQLEEGIPPPDVLVTSILEGNVEIYYGSTGVDHSAVFEDDGRLIANPGAPYLMKLLGECAIPYDTDWKWSGGGDVA